MSRFKELNDQVEIIDVKINFLTQVYAGYDMFGARNYLYKKREELYKMMANEILAEFEMNQNANKLTK